MHTSYSSHSAEEWQHIMDTYSESGLSQKTFCQQENLAVSTFSKWRKQLGLVRRQPIPEMMPDFQPLLPDSWPTGCTSEVEGNATHRSNDWDVELALGSGVTLRIRATG